MYHYQELLRQRYYYSAFKGSFSSLRPSSSTGAQDQAAPPEPGGAQEGEVWQRGAPGKGARHSQFRIEVTELLVDSDVALPALQFGHSPLILTAISLAGTARGCLGAVLLPREGRGVVRPTRERHRGRL